MIHRKANQEKIKSLLGSLVNGEDYKLQPATDEQMKAFVKTAAEKCVPQNVIVQLTELYEVANDYTYEIVLAFHNCADEIIFEWWDEDRELWLGQRDFHTLRWANEKFCLGDAGNISFGKEYEADTLIQLIEICLKDIEEANCFGENGK